MRTHKHTHARTHTHTRTRVREVPRGIVHQLVGDLCIAMEALNVRQEHLPLNDPLRYPRSRGAVLLIVNRKMNLQLPLV